MIVLLTVIIAFISVLLMVVVLIQNPKGGGVDSTFGGQSANQMVGAARSTDLIEKLTWGLFIAVIVLCILTTKLISGL